MATATLIGGGIRLDRETELALNILLRREGGEHEGMALFKLEWCADTNRGLHVPVCFTTNPMSYHILVWEPPSIALTMYETQLKQDTSKGTYNCVTHFESADGIPFAPTIFVIEKVIPILKRAQETARAALMGQNAIVQRNRAKRKEQLVAIEKAKERAYDNYAESILNDSKPAFDGNPMSTSKGSAGIVLTDLQKTKPNIDVPDKFDFTVRTKRPS
jgi:hypothetical protein